ncbi:hypothetical protein [Bacillus sp. AFS075034]|uniref:hypothetical protein n=1 Tax=Bacillus sp. AFS075034 TaxID=2034281 RepID=UPI000BF29482|nr:hypothetical protein [Bacillus sp. AFS075034]PFW61535.1 hypothetical protein COL20_16980 [Bacillus sp. AFS075034]
MVFGFGCLTGYLVGTLVTILMIRIYFMCMDREADKTERNWHEITEIDKSVEKEMEQLKSIRDDKG